MIPEIRIIHQLSTNGIFETTLLTESDLKAWVADGGYSVSKCLAHSSGNRVTKFKLSPQKVDALHASLANDCNRFALAAIESMWSVGKVSNLPKSTGWAAVKMYYSAFFAAHALLRIYGRSCSQLERDHVAKVLEIAKVTQLDGGASRIDNGFYFSLFANKEIEFKKLKGSHADTWSSFSDLLTWLINKISDTKGRGIHKSEAMTLISNIKTAIHLGGANKGNWLSQIRNKINYQHTHGVWYPYEGASHDTERVLKNSEWLKDPSYFELDAPKNDISTLYSVSNSILSLMYHLMKYGYERSGEVSLPLSNGTFSLIKQMQLV